MIIRTACYDDSFGIAKVRVDCWRTTYQGIVPEKHLQGLSYEAIEKQFQELLSSDKKDTFIYVAEYPLGNIAGFAFGGFERGGSNDFKGEIYAMYILQEYQGSGIGRQLMQASAACLLEMGIQSMLVWVLEKNPFCCFYEHLGGKITAQDTYTIDGAKLNLVAYGWGDITVLL